MYTVNTGMVPSCIQDLIPPLVSEVSDCSLRNNRNTNVNQTSITQKSCISPSIRLWNTLTDDFKIHHHYQFKQIQTYNFKV